VPRAVSGGRGEDAEGPVGRGKANEKVFKAKVRTTLRSSYSSYYRQMLPSIRFYRPDDTPPGSPALGGSLICPIRWELIAQQPR
jgi:hypothetical protein